MSVEQLNEIKQQLSALTAAEKRDLAAFLSAQAKPDQEAGFANGAVSAQTNGEPPQSADPNEPDPFRELEMRWLREHREEYAGQYVALWRDQLVAHGTDWRSVLAEARAAGVARPLMARVEALDELPFGGW
jgi:ribonuclease D